MGKSTRSTATAGTIPVSPPAPAPKTLGGKVSALEHRLGALESSVKENNKTSTDILTRISTLFPVANVDTPSQNIGTTTPQLPVGGGKIITRSTPAHSGTTPYGRQPAPQDPASLAGASAAAAAPDAANNSLATALLPGLAAHQQPQASALLDTFAPSVYQPSVLPTSMQLSTDPVVNQRVQALLDTAQHISGVKGKHTHPHDYITRGPTRVKTTLSLLEPAEYLYGLSRLASDDKTPALDKPKIQAHFYDVIQDAKDFDWDQVRDWSEEVLTGVAEGAIRWSDPIRPEWMDPRISALRSETSRVRSGRLFPTVASVSVAADAASLKAADKAAFLSRPMFHYNPTASYSVPAYNAGSAPTSQSTQQAQPNRRGANNKRQPRSSANRTDVVCDAYNTTAGCPKQDGHMQGNMQHGHHCSWCRTNLQLIHTHSLCTCTCKTGSKPNTQPFRA